MKDGAMAWDEWKKNMLASHAEAYPNIWYGIWSGPDFYRSTLSPHPGETQYADPSSSDPRERNDWGADWTDCPVMCQHQHAWPLYTVAKLMGLEFHETGINLQPVLPMAEYDFNSKLVGMKKGKTGYAGWYEPSVAGTWKVEIRLPEAERAKVHSVKVNGTAQAVAGTSGAIEFKGASQPAKALRWELLWS